MQPPAVQKPVVDVLAPKRPASTLPPRPSVPLAVREAPAREAAASHSSAPTPTSNSSAVQTQPKPESQANATVANPTPSTEDTTVLQPGPQKVNPSNNTPVGAIVTAIFVMIILSALTVAIYLKG